MYREIRLISPGRIYGQRTNLMGLYSEGLYSGGTTLQFKSVKLITFLFFPDFVITNSHK